MRNPVLRSSVTLLSAAVVILSAHAAFATGEPITDVRILGNARTNEDTVRSIAGVKIGDVLEADTLETVRERLNTVGLFADVNVWWETQGEGVRVNIAVKDKFPWAPVPTGSWSANNKSLGLLFVHGNLFGRGKQMVIGARIATLDSGAVLAYRDPALFGSWFYWEMKALWQTQLVPEYDVNALVPRHPWRETTINSYGFEPAFGIAWFRRVKTQVSWRLDKINPRGQSFYDPNDSSGTKLPDDPEGVTTRGGVAGIGRAAVSFDWRAREHAVMRGAALGGNIDVSSSTFQSDFNFWRASVFYEQGIKILRRHNFYYSVGGTLGHNLPIWWDTTAGGSSLRGYLVQQYRGDTQLNGRAEYHFPLFSIGSLDFRALGFYDSAAIWFRDLPELQGSYLARTNGDFRTFNPLYQTKGFDMKRDLHNDVGGGLRFFLRSVAVPLVGFDAGYGLESKHWNFILIIGA